MATVACMRVTRSGAGSNDMPAATYSSRFQPAPMPISSRPSVMASMVASSCASTAGWRRPLLSTKVPIRSALASAADWSRGRVAHRPRWSVPRSTEIPDASARCASSTTLSRVPARESIIRPKRNGRRSGGWSCMRGVSAVRVCLVESRPLPAMDVKRNPMGDKAPAPEPIQWLGDATGGSDLLGGKAASIDRLARLGVATPPGFCITTDAFRQELLDGPMGDAAARALADLPDEGARLALTALAIDAPLTRELGLALAASLDRLDGAATFGIGGPARLAVRSSAVGEDGAFSSFAGMHDTELGVSRDEVEPAVRRCWASLWSERAIGYRRMRSLPLDGGARAGAAQALVPARAAAAAFPRHPVTGGGG